MKYLILLFLIPSFVFSQPDYKISAEGFTFGKPAGNTVKLTVFLSAANIGSIEEFTGQLRNIKLISKKYSSASYLLDEYKRIINNNKNINGYAVFSLSYIVPVDANDISLQLPEIYGSLIIPITYENYEQWVQKENTTGNSSDNMQSAKKGIYGKTLDYIGYSLSGGYGINQHVNEIQSINVDLNVQIKVFKFGKNNKYTLFGQAGYMWRFSLGNKNDNAKYFGLNNPHYTTEFDFGTDTTRMMAGLVYGGVGFGFRINDINIITAVNYGNLFQELSGTRIKDTVANIEYRNPDFKMDVWKIDIGLLYKYLYVGYSFIYGDMKKGNPIIDGAYRIHNFKIGIGGF